MISNFLLIFWAPFFSSANTIHYLYSDSFFNTDISFAKDGDEWTRVDKDGNIAMVTIKISAWRGYDGDEEPRDDISDVQYEGSQDAFLVKGIKISSKQIKIFKIQRPISSSTPAYIEFGPEKEKIHFLTSGNDDPQKGPDRAVTNYELKIKFHNEEIILIKEAEARYVDGSSPYSPSWAGDLNEDGFPDFIIYHPTHVSGANQSILLLSKRGKKITYQRVATIARPGC